MNSGEQFNAASVGRLAALDGVASVSVRGFPPAGRQSAGSRHRSGRWSSTSRRRATRPISPVATSIESRSAQDMARRSPWLRVPARQPTASLPGRPGGAVGRPGGAVGRRAPGRSGPPCGGFAARGRLSDVEPLEAEDRRPHRPVVVVRATAATRTDAPTRGVLVRSSYRSVLPPVGRAGRGERGEGSIEGGHGKVGDADPEATPERKAVVVRHVIICG